MSLFREGFLEVEALIAGSGRNKAWLSGPEDAVLLRMVEMGCPFNYIYFNK